MIDFFWENLSITLKLETYSIKYNRAKFLKYKAVLEFYTFKFCTKFRRSLDQTAHIIQREMKSHNLKSIKSYGISNHRFKFEVVYKIGLNQSIVSKMYIMVQILLNVIIQFLCVLKWKKINRFIYHYIYLLLFLKYYWIIFFSK